MPGILHIDVYMKICVCVYRYTYVYVHMHIAEILEDRYTYIGGFQPVPLYGLICHDVNIYIYMKDAGYVLCKCTINIMHSSINLLTSVYN